jgi:hypothetical protein
VQVLVSFSGSSVSDSRTQNRVKVVESFIGNLTKVFHLKVFFIIEWFEECRQIMVKTEAIMVYPSCYSYILFDSIRKAHNISVTDGTMHLVNTTQRCTSRLSKYGRHKRKFSLYDKFTASYRLSTYVPPSH